MPFDNSYTRGINNKLSNIASKINHVNRVAENPADIQATNQQYFSTAVSHPELDGGSG